ncbi:MAG: DUF255 domain-containing protein [Planctomycetota bacterium]|nr:DUF255 domain-containing protein [Planctomycetota bacterium]
MSASTPHPHDDHAAALKNPDGSWKFTNALAKQTSPYLLQHAHNPVDWHAWGPQAFELAQKQNKPIFLSIGYSTCYWCHVMERQSFENVATATVMNEHFINIKVDREERPDVDDIYMMAVQLMTGHGGWPMSVFLTPPGAAGPDDPGLKPFYAGTYFPPEPRHGMPSFPDLLRGLARAWTQQRGDVMEQCEQAAQGVREQLARRDEPGEVGPEMVQASANGLLRNYDARHGGFGGAPKFPTPVNVLFLQRVFLNNPNASLGDAIAHTLDAMARGGMYDQVGGGFHRYSTDERWLVPHFEKMLYDNGQLLEAYARAQAIAPPKGEPGLYRRVMSQTCEYLLREMTDPTGAFWSAQDAEVDAREGGNYLWTPDQVREAVADPALAELALKLYGLDRGTNFQDPHHTEEPPSNVLYLPVPLLDFAAKAGRSLDDLLAAKAEIDRRMLKARLQRKQASTDDKVLTSWNGMAIAGMAMAGAALNEPRYTKAAAGAADYLLAKMRDARRGLLRTMRKGEAKIDGFLDDYAALAHGLIELHRATGEARWLEAAKEIVAEAQRRFAEEPEAETAEDAPLAGGYFDTLANRPDLFVRTRSTYDGAIPSGNSQMVHNLLDLFELTGEKGFFARAWGDLASFSAAMRRSPSGMPHMHHALLRALELAPRAAGEEAHGAKPAEPTKRGGTGADDTRRLPLRVAVEPDRIELGDEPVELAVTLKVHPEYHLNAHEPGIEGVVATALRLEGAAGWEMEVVYPTGKPRRYAFADRPLAVYEDTVVLHATIRRRATPSGEASLGPPRLTLRFQVCTDQTCLEPREEELPVELVLAG